MKNPARFACLLSLILVVSAVLAAPALAQGTADGHTFINVNDTKWGDAPPTLPKGAKLAVLEGDPGKPAAFTMRLMMPANYNIAPHWHTQDENLTVVSGALYLGMGDKTDKAKARALNSGGFHFLPGKAHHYAFTEADTVVQIHGTGPFDINYLDPADDPLKTSK
ncbi:MAG: cupin domain-containing protein [Acidobacteriota bacterium]